MKEVEIMTRLLVAIFASQKKAAFDAAFVDEKILKVPPEERDRVALEAIEEGYIKGLRIIDGIDGQEVPYIAWEYSKPSLTMKGHDFLDNNSTAKKVLKELKDTAVSFAAQTVSAIISSKF